MTSTHENKPSEAFDDGLGYSSPIGLVGDVEVIEYGAFDGLRGFASAGAPAVQPGVPQRARAQELNCPSRLEVFVERYLFRWRYCDVLR